MNKHLIVSADDYGYNPEQTKAITELYENKLITASSVLTVAPDAENAAKTAVEKGFSVGVHWTINSDGEESRWQSLTGAKSLGDEKGLYHGQKDIALHAKRKDVRSEIEKQILFLKERGCAVDHADNHCATLYGINGRRFFIDAYEFCKQYNLPYRFPKTPGFLERQLGRAIPKPLMLYFNHIVSEGTKRGVKLLDDLISNPWSMSRIKDYETLRKYYIDALDGIGEGITEMFLHPAYPADGGEEWKKRVYEFELLKSGDLLCEAEKRNIKLVSWSVFDNTEE